MKVKKQSKRTERTVLKKIRNIDDVQKIVTILFVSMILSAAVAFWPLVFVIFGMIIALEVTALLLRIVHRNDKEKDDTEKAPAEKKETTENDVIDMAFGIAMKRITQFLRINFPSATWAFEGQRPKAKFANNQPLYITLSNAQGYKKARVALSGLFVTGLVYDTYEALVIQPKPQEVIELEPDETEEDCDDDSQDSPTEKKVNYEFVADEWIENNMEMINEQLNNAAAKNKTEHFLEETILPVKESWELIAERLVESGVKEATKEEHGIRITFQI